jgi:hypothetical protein
MSAIMFPAATGKTILFSQGVQHEPVVSLSFLMYAPFIKGIGFELLRDHKPLIPILNQYSLAEIENKRLQQRSIIYSSTSPVACTINV